MQNQIILLCNLEKNVSFDFFDFFFFKIKTTQKFTVCLAAFKYATELCTSWGGHFDIQSLLIFISALFADFTILMEQDSRKPIRKKLHCQIFLQSSQQFVRDSFHHSNDSPAKFHDSYQRTSF